MISAPKKSTAFDQVGEKHAVLFCAFAAFFFEMYFVVLDEREREEGRYEGCGGRR